VTISHDDSTMNIILVSLCPRLEHYKMGRGVRPSIHLSVCGVPRTNLSTERPRKLKTGMMEAHHTGNP